MHIDLNCDLGEGGGFDAELMPLITSANIACGGHAGDSATMLETLRLACKHRVQVGAHPGYFDRENFGRREIVQGQDELYDDCMLQIQALNYYAERFNISIRYLKPHGAMYHQACRDAAYAGPIVAAAQLCGGAVMGLPGSELERQCGSGTRFIAEGFADRRYLSDGSLVPRTQPNAFIETAEEAVEQVDWLIRERRVETICVHGDNPQAVEFVRALRTALEQQGIAIRPFDV